MMLEIDAVVVRYSGFELGPISFAVEDGAFLSLIGTNGSGKSTLIRALLGLNERLVSGNVLHDGETTLRRSPAVLSAIGYVSDSNKDVLGEFTAREYWNYCRLAYEQASGERVDDLDERVEELAANLDFPLDLRRPLSALSLGTSRKAQIIAALLFSPSLLVLDEPFIGLDFIAARALEELLREERDSGTTIIASSHDLDLASRLADRTLVLHHGAVALNAKVEDIGGHRNLESAVRASLEQARSEVR